MPPVEHLPTHSNPTSPVETLPPLPEIHSEELVQRIFTHNSVCESNRPSFQSPEGNPSADNEELKHIGDQAFALAVTDLIQSLYPHLRVGPASKVRDHVKRKAMVADICVLYGLHERLRMNLPKLQANDLRDSQSVQVDVFKAYVGALYREQGMEAVSRWLDQIFQSRVEAAYQISRRDHLLPPNGPALQQPEAPAARYPSPGAGPVFPRLLAMDCVDARPEGINRRNRRRRRRSSSRGMGGSWDGGTQRCVHRDGNIDMTFDIVWYLIGPRYAAPSLVDRLRHGRECKEAGEVNGTGRFMIAIRATILSAFSPRLPGGSTRRELSEETREGGKLSEMRGL